MKTRIFFQYFFISVAGLIIKRLQRLLLIPGGPCIHGVTWGSAAE